MSTIAYAQLTNARDAAKPGTSSSESSPGIRTYIDAFAALVPAEVLTLHALIMSVSIQQQPSTQGGEKAQVIATAINPEALGTLHTSFWILILLSIALFVVPRYFGGRWDRFDWIRASISPLAFVGWTMLQRVTVFDAAFPNLHDPARTIYALILGAILGGVTAALAAKADAKKAPTS